jgi:alkyl hydroperoxide reductase subunit AhpC
MAAIASNFAQAKPTATRFNLAGSLNPHLFVVEMISQFMGCSLAPGRLSSRSNNHWEGITIMLTIGDKFPQYKLQACVSLESGKEFQEFTETSFTKKWKVIFFWPMDFTFICPTEIAAFGKRQKEFQEKNAVVLGASTDTHYVHLAWRKDHADLRDLPFPMLADTKRELSSELGILHKQSGVALRATFIVDPENTIRFVSVNDLSVGRSVDEVLRTLSALQTGELCPVEWKPGQATL